MDFSLTSEELEFQRQLRDWLTQNLPAGWKGSESLPKTEPHRTNFLRDWQRRLYDGGWAGIAWPKEYGGRGASLLEEVIYQEEMARVKAPPVVNIIGIGMIGPTLIQIGTEAQKRRYVHKILNGEEIWCQGYSEPGAGSDLAAIQTRAVKQGDKWVIHGQKVWTSYAHIADRCFLLARTDSSGAKHEGMTAFLVDMHQPGIETRPIHQMSDHYDFNEIFFTDAVAYEEDVVGAVGEGWKVAVTLLMHERVGVARQVFSLQREFGDIVHLSKTLTYRGGRLVDDPVVRRKLVEYYARSRGALLTYYRHLTQTMKTGHPGAEGSMDKLLCSELGKDLLGYAVSLQGAYSPLWHEDAYVNPGWQDAYLESLGLTIAGGTTEIQKNVVAERVLGLPKDIKY